MQFFLAPLHKNCGAGWHPARGWQPRWSVGSQHARPITNRPPIDNLPHTLLGREGDQRFVRDRAVGLERESAPHSGVTLLEMLIVVAIIATIASISFPALTAGLAGVRLSSSAGDVATFITTSMNDVERHEQASAIEILPKENRLATFTAASGEKPVRVYQPPTGVSIEGDDPHRYLLFPGGAFPKISVVLRNEKGARRSVEIDPVTAVPQIRRIEDAPR